MCSRPASDCYEGWKINYGNDNLFYSKTAIDAYRKFCEQDFSQEQEASVNTIIRSNAVVTDFNYSFNKKIDCKGSRALPGGPGTEPIAAADPVAGFFKGSKLHRESIPQESYIGLQYHFSIPANNFLQSCLFIFRRYFLHGPNGSCRELDVISNVTDSERLNYV